jgi:hypothetical protein
MKEGQMVSNHALLTLAGHLIIIAPRYSINHS